VTLIVLSSSWSTDTDSGDLECRPFQRPHESALLSVMGLPLFSMRRIVAVPPPEAFEIIDANREELVQPEFPWIPAFLGRSIAAALAKAQAGTLERPLCGAISRRRDGQLRALLLPGPSS
jgi:hypothetical protein